MTDKERINFEKEYLKILVGKINEGITLLKNTSITDTLFKDLVVNINNANNITLQLENDIKEFEKEKTEQPAETAE